MTGRITISPSGVPCIERDHPDESAPCLDWLCSDCYEPADGLDRLTPVCEGCAEQRRAERRLERGRERDDL